MHKHIAVFVISHWKMYLQFTIVFHICSFILCRFVSVQGALKNHLVLLPHFSDQKSEITCSESHAKSHCRGIAGAHRSTFKALCFLWAHSMLVTEHTMTENISLPAEFYMVTSLYFILNEGLKKSTWRAFCFRRLGNVTLLRSSIKWSEAMVKWMSISFIIWPWKELDYLKC